MMNFNFHSNPLMPERYLFLYFRSECDHTKKFVDHAHFFKILENSFAQNLWVQRIFFGCTGFSKGFENPKKVHELKSLCLALTNIIKILQEKIMEI